jgi:putative aminopeptidase FrvX
VRLPRDGPRFSFPGSLFLTIGLVCAVPLGVAAQSASDSLDGLAARLAGMSAVTGLEQRLVDTLMSMLPGSRRDRAGNAVLTLGSGKSRRLAVCPVDEPGYVVGRVREDGWLTLRRSPGRPSAARDAQLEGQRVSIHTARDIVPGVVAVRSVHLTRGREPALRAFTVDSALVDVGAGSEAEAGSLGIQVLAPVTLHKRPHRYGRGLLAAPMAGRRAACAALLVAARRASAEQGRIPRREAVVIAFVVEQELSGRGLGTVANSAGPFEETVVVDGEGWTPGGGMKPWPSLGRVVSMPLSVRYLGTPVETVAISDADRLASELAAWIRGSQ